MVAKQAYRVPGARPAIRGKELPAYIAQNAGFVWARDKETGAKKGPCRTTIWKWRNEGAPVGTSEGVRNVIFPKPLGVGRYQFWSPDEVDEFLADLAITRFTYYEAD